MNSYRRHATVIEILLIACTVSSILSAVLLVSMLDHADFLNRLAAGEGRVVLTAVIEFEWAATGAGIVIVLYPVIRGHSRALPLGSMAARVAEGVFVLIGARGESTERAWAAMPAASRGARIEDPTGGRSRSRE